MKSNFFKMIPAVLALALCTVGGAWAQTTKATKPVAIGYRCDPNSGVCYCSGGPASADCKKLSDSSDCGRKAGCDNRGRCYCTPPLSASSARENTARPVITDSTSADNDLGWKKVIQAMTKQEAIALGKKNCARLSESSHQDCAAQDPTKLVTDPTTGLENWQAGMCVCH